LSYTSKKRNFITHENINANSVLIFERKTARLLRIFCSESGANSAKSPIREHFRYKKDQHDGLLISESKAESRYQSTSIFSPAAGSGGAAGGAGGWARWKRRLVAEAPGASEMSWALIVL
jgi:hypothetical protein